MATTLDDLLKYKAQVELKNPKNGKTLRKVWVKVLGDEDLKEAFKFARIASSTKRLALRDKNSSDYAEQALGLREMTREEHEALILVAKENEFANQAPIVIPREDKPEMEEVAQDPDAPTLEEQERYDEATEEVDNKFVKGVEEYIQTKIAELKVELAEKDDEGVLKMAMEAHVDVQSLQEFVNELNDQRGYRSVYMDEACKVRGYSDIEAFKNAAAAIKTQIVQAYNSLEIDNDDIKN